MIFKLFLGLLFIIRDNELLSYHLLNILNVLKLNEAIIGTYKLAFLLAVDHKVFGLVLNTIALVEEVLMTTDSLLNYLLSLLHHQIRDNFIKNVENLLLDFSESRFCNIIQIMLVSKILSDCLQLATASFLRNQKKSICVIKALIKWWSKVPFIRYVILFLLQFLKLNQLFTFQWTTMLFFIFISLSRYQKRLLVLVVFELFDW